MSAREKGRKFFHFLFCGRFLVCCALPHLIAYLREAARAILRGSERARDRKREGTAEKKKETWSGRVHAGAL